MNTTHILSQSMFL